MVELLQNENPIRATQSIQKGRQFDMPAIECHLLFEWLLTDVIKFSSFFRNPYLIWLIPYHIKCVKGHGPFLLIEESRPFSVSSWNRVK